MAECLKDAGRRAAQRERAAERRTEEDVDLAARTAAAIRQIFPRCSPAEAEAIAAHTTKRSSGRVGRTAAGQALDDGALTAAMTAAVRHNHTRYDELLMSGYDRADAREAVHDKVDDVLERWRGNA